MSQLPKDLLDILACPRCRGPLVVEPVSLRCDACRLRYRVDDGIPVMLVHEAERLDGGDPELDAGTPAVS
jgi:uncharacterized protein YbaR (Trm112 family)